MRKARNTLRSDKTANDQNKERIADGEAERDLQPTHDTEKEMREDEIPLKVTHWRKAAAALLLRQRRSQ